MSMNLSTATLHANKLTLLQMVVLYISTGRRCSFPIRTNVSDEVSRAHRLLRLPTGGGGGEYGGAALQVLWLASPRRAAADGDGVNAAGIAVAGAVVAPSPSVP